MNLVKKSLVERGIRGGVGAFGGVEALVRVSSLSTLNLRTGPWPANSFCSPMESTGGLTQGLR